jgi:hypothetical protein
MAYKPYEWGKYEGKREKTYVRPNVQQLREMQRRNMIGLIACGNQFLAIT